LALGETKEEPMLVLVAYATKKGSTQEVAEAVASTLAECGLSVEMKRADKVARLDGYEAVVLGSAIYMGHLHADARRFLSHNEDALATLPVAVFAMGPFSLDETQVAGSRKQLDAALAKVPSLTPVSIAIFGGVLDPGEHRFPFSRMAESDARDWNAIGVWAEEVAVEFSAAQAEPRTLLPAGAAASSR
jgi:menaquinone-dependent protoporphyrinogen oxidase